ncbi:hypothetical protein ACTXT7_003764 [Hymenolepis weldensis]
MTMPDYATLQEQPKISLNNLAGSHASPTIFAQSSLAPTEFQHLFRSRYATPTVGPAEQKTQENLRAILGNLATIEPSTEPTQKLSVPTTLEIPPAVSQNDSFGMTNAHFLRRESLSSDIDSPVSEKPRASPQKRISHNLSPPSQKSNLKFMDFFKRNSSSPNPPDTPNDGSTLTLTSHGDTSMESSNRLSVGGRAAKLFSKMRMHSGEVSDSHSSLVSPTIPQPQTTSKAERVKILPPISPNSVSTAPRDENKPANLKTYMHDRVQSAYESNFTTSHTRNYSGHISVGDVLHKPKHLKKGKFILFRSIFGVCGNSQPPGHASSDFGYTGAGNLAVMKQDQPSKSTNRTSHHERDEWCHGDLSSLDSDTFTFKKGSTSANDSEGSEKPVIRGPLARKILNAPGHHRGLIKKWVPSGTGQKSHYSWAVLEGCRLSFYENERAPALGGAPLAVFNVHNSTVISCPPKTSKSHNNVLQLNLEDGTEILLAANTLENCNQWYNHLKSASRSVLPLPLISLPTAEEANDLIKRLRIPGLLNQSQESKDMYRNSLDKSPVNLTKEMQVPNLNHSSTLDRIISLVSVKQDGNQTPQLGLFLDCTMCVVFYWVFVYRKADDNNLKAIQNVTLRTMLGLYSRPQMNVRVLAEKFLNETSPHNCAQRRYNRKTFTEFPITEIGKI